MLRRYEATVNDPGASDEASYSLTIVPSQRGGVVHRAGWDRLRGGQGNRQQRQASRRAAPSFSQQARHFAYSHGERFLSAGQTVILGKNGHFTFSATCSKDNTGQNQVTFDVTANTTADLDGGGPVPAGMKVNIHTDSDALNSTPDAPLKPGDFT